jgi:hypothetical protein
MEAAMGTRHAKSGTALRQEKYASDPAFNDRLLASTVARKCRLFSDPAHKALCMHLQYVSMQPGGLSAFVDDFLHRYGDRVGSKTMRANLGRERFAAGLVKTIREELRTRDFPLYGEQDTIDPFGLEIAKAEDFDLNTFESPDDIRARHRKQSLLFPKTYSAAAFSEYCLEKAYEYLEELFIDLCLNPETRFEHPPVWFCELESSMHDYIADRRTDRMAGKIVTTVGEQINDALDYALEENCMVHINGIARMGKTHQVKEWCEARPGQARYIQVPSGQDDISFFRTIARALGTASGSAMKATQIRRQIEDTIEDSGLMLIFDEAHLLWPQMRSVRNSPKRISWLMTSVVNKGVSAALISTPQFDISQKTTVDSTGWADEQLDGRIAYRLNLPSTLPIEDLSAIARHYLPQAEDMVIKGLCSYAQASGKFIAGIEAVAKRARYLAKKTGHLVPDTAALLQALQDVDPSIAQMSSVTETAKAVRQKPAQRSQGRCGVVAETEKRSDKRETVGR